MIKKQAGVYISFSRARILVLTEQESKIDSWIKLNVLGRSYNVKLWEELKRRRRRILLVELIDLQHNMNLEKSGRSKAKKGKNQLKNQYEENAGEILGASLSTVDS